MADWLKNKRITKYLTPYRLAFLINGCFLLAFLISGTMKYETSDDFLMEMIVSGSYSGDASPYIMFMNPLIGVLLSFLYQITTSVNWYFYFQLLLIYCSMSIITAQLFKKRTDALSVLCSLAFVSFFSHDLYQLMQFTKTAMICLACGELLVLENMTGSAWNKKETAIGIVLAAVGAMIRRTCLMIAMAFAAVNLLLWLWAKYRQGDSVFAFKRISICVCIIGAVFGFVWGTSAGYDLVHPKYAAFNDYQAVRASIIDYEPPAYQEISQELQAIDISENDYYNLILYQVGDRSVYTDEKMEQIANIVNEHQELPSFSEIFNKIISRHYERYLCVLGVLSLGFLLCALKKNTVLAFLCHFCAAFLLLLYLYIQRRVVYRAEFIIFLTMAVNLLYLFISNENRLDRHFTKSSMICSALILLLSVPSFIPRHDYGYTAMFESWENHLSKYRVSFIKNKQNELLKEINDNPDHIYYMGFQSTIQSVYLNYDPRLPMQADSLFDNAVYLGGVSFMHPSHSDWLLEHRLSENMDELLKDHVYLIENNHEDVFLKFIQEHYNQNAKLKPVKEVDGYQIWKIYVDNDFASAN